MGSLYNWWVVESLVVTVPHAALSPVRNMATLCVVPIGLLKGHGVLWLGLAVQRWLVKVLPMMVRLPEKRGLVVKLWPGEKFLPGGTCLPDEKFLLLQTVHHAESCLVS